MAQIAWFDTLESTNDKARDTEFGHGDLIVAEAQSAGRGQRGNSWDSRLGENLTFSLVLEPKFLPADQQFLLLQTVALGIVDLLRAYGIAACIKWTNDVYVGDRKIAGVLIENDICGSNLSRSIVGIGLNVNQSQFASWVPNPTSMAIENGCAYDRKAVLNALWGAIMNRYRSIESCDNTDPEGIESVSVESVGIESLQSDYHSLLYLLDTPHTFLLPCGTRLTGIIRGVEITGELQVEHPDGHTEGYLFKEISFSIND